MIACRVFRVSAATDAELRQWFSEADASRQAQVLRLRRVQAKKQCLCADHLVRDMLRAHGIVPEFARDENGKPFLLSGALHFNLTHSGDYVACALHNAPIGIDLEALREVSPALMDKVCSVQEQEYILLDGTFDSTRFLQVWTAKEAYLKYLGCGVRCDLRKVEVVTNGTLAISGASLHTELTEEFALAYAHAQ